MSDAFLERMFSLAGKTAVVVGGTGVLVVNPHGWAADLVAEVEVPEHVAPLGPDGPVAFEVLSDCAGLRRIRFAVPGLPALGWRFLPLSDASETRPGGEAGPGRRWRSGRRTAS